MSRVIKTHKIGLLSLVFALAVLAAAVPALSLRHRWTQPQPVEEIVLVARDVAFWHSNAPGQSNPTLRLVRGRPVRLILRNDEPDAVLHCFTIGGLDVKSTRDLAGGDSEILCFTPDQSGTFTYACLMHPSMTGRVVVE
ncbi:MAG: cupredoxin domain-containing protein [Tepidisphaeraceae bacterium]